MGVLFVLLGKNIKLGQYQGGVDLEGVWGGEEYE